MAGITDKGWLDIVAKYKKAEEEAWSSNDEGIQDNYNRTVNPTARGWAYSYSKKEPSQGTESLTTGETPTASTGNNQSSSNSASTKITATSNTVSNTKNTSNSTWYDARKFNKNAKGELTWNWRAPYLMQNTYTHGDKTYDVRVDNNDQSWFIDRLSGKMKKVQENTFGGIGFVNAGNMDEGWIDILPEHGVFRKQGGIMVTKHQQGGAAPQQDIQQQVVALVQAAMLGDLKATQTVNQIMEAAKAGDQQATQLAQMIQQVVQKMKTSAKWGAKLQYIKSLKYAKGGKTCPACMEKGGSTEKTKGVKTVAKKDVDDETYKKLSTWERGEIDVNHDTYATSDNKDGSFNTKHKLTGLDSITINKKHMSPQMIKRYSEKKECGGKAKKRYFGGWL